jgi:hypothetical protein
MEVSLCFSICQRRNKNVCAFCNSAVVDCSRQGSYWEYIGKGPRVFLAPPLPLPHRLHQIFENPPYPSFSHPSLCFPGTACQCRFTKVNFLSGKYIMHNWKRRTDEQTVIIPIARWIFMSEFTIRSLITNNCTRWRGIFEGTVSWDGFQ